ncbi:MAG: T9SS type A sorting domain-containing protein, partial [Bacteroidota bacterium]
ADTTYVLAGIVFLEEGGVLNIAAGTIVRTISQEEEGLASGLVIARGAQIFAEGTAEDPIIFTTQEDDLFIPDEAAGVDNGEWMGLVILGRAPTAHEDGGNARYTPFGLDDGRLAYGGGDTADEADNSGVLRYVSIRHAAAFAATQEEAAGLVLGGVGHGTTIDHVEVIRSQTDGFRFLGGTVNAYHLVSAYSGDDAFDLQLGYQGLAQFWLGVDAQDRMLEIGGGWAETTERPLIPELANLTLVQTRTIIDDLSGVGTVVYRGNTAGSLRNSVIVNAEFVGLSLQDIPEEEDADSWAYFNEGVLQLENNHWNLEYRNITGWDNYATLIIPGTGIRTATTLSAYMEDNNPILQGFQIQQSETFDPAIFDPRPRPESGLVEGGIPIFGEGFTTVDYQGAFGPADDWYAWSYLGSASGVFQRISGRVQQAEVDCTVGGEATPAGQVTIVLQNGLTNLYATTGENGFFSANVPIGTTSLSVVPPSTSWMACPPPAPITLVAGEDATVDLALRAVENCARPEVSIGAPFLRRGFPSTYQLTYTNVGGATALNAEVAVVLDSLLMYSESSIPLARQVADTLFFAVGDLLPLQAPQQFSLTVLVSLDASLGQEHCSEALILSESDCGPGPGALLRVSGSCVGDSVLFRVDNLGPLAPTEPVPYIVIEDEVMLRQGTLSPPAGGSESFAFLATEGTFHFSTLAEPDAISSRKAAATVSCADNPTTPFAAFSSLGPLPNSAVDCQPNIGAYDPNDKAVTPTGLTQDNVVPVDVTLDYRIRFQNTGTDTAFTVVVVDTLPPALDPATFVMGAYSHPCTWTLEGERTLKVTFDNIMLPDSNVNEPASNGFFTFRISTKPDLELDVEINNEADIYFDFNDPIRTNQTQQITGRLKSKPLAVRTPLLGQEALLVYPQPATEQLQFALKDGQWLRGEWTIFSADGRLVAGGTASGATQQISLAGWRKGLYVLVVRDAAQRLLARRRFVVQ